MLNTKYDKIYIKTNSHFESCFVEIENKNIKNTLIGVIYRVHTAIDNFITDVDPILQIISNKKKECYIMDDYNIDLLKDNSDRTTHDYLDLIYSHCMIPTILKPTRITETSATIIDNILTNCDNEVTTAILVTDITDHLPTILVDITDHLPTILVNKTKNVNAKNRLNNEKGFAYKRKYTYDNISHFKQKLSQVNWDDILHGFDVNQDYNEFIVKFNELFDQCLPLRKCNVNRPKVPQSPWITKGMLKSIQNKNKLY